MRGCGEELCEHWSGDGRVCPCAIFGIESDDTEAVDMAAAPDDGDRESW